MLKNRTAKELEKYVILRMKGIIILDSRNQSTMGAKEAILKLFTPCIKTLAYYHRPIDPEGYTPNAVHFGKTYVLRCSLPTIIKLKRFIHFYTILIN